ncbi:hypothetical protein V8F33_003470 [Rhypophila sp. PSN 637]
MVEQPYQPTPAASSRPHRASSSVSSSESLPHANDYAPSNGGHKRKASLPSHAPSRQRSKAKADWILDHESGQYFHKHSNGRGRKDLSDVRRFLSLQTALCGWHELSSKGRFGSLRAQLDILSASALSTQTWAAVAASGGSAGSGTTLSRTTGTENTKCSRHLHGTFRPRLGILRGPHQLVRPKRPLTMIAGFMETFCSSRSSIMISDEKLDTDIAGEKVPMTPEKSAQQSFKEGKDDKKRGEKEENENNTIEHGIGGPARDKADRRRPDSDGSLAVFGRGVVREKERPGSGGADGAMGGTGDGEVSWQDKGGVGDERALDQGEDEEVSYDGGHRVQGYSL